MFRLFSCRVIVIYSDISCQLWLIKRNIVSEFQIHVYFMREISEDGIMPPVAKW